MRRKGSRSRKFYSRLPAAARLVLVAAALFVSSVAGAAAQDPIQILSHSVPLHPDRPDLVTIGQLRYRGGVALRAPDDRFGGFSDLQVNFDGTRLLAISDRGAWMEAAIVYDEDGRLTGLAEARLGPLIGPDGEVLTGAAADAEAMAALPDGSILVAFERSHRLLLYPQADPPFSAPPEAFPPPTRLSQAPANGGIEALAHVGSSFLVAIAEKLRAVGGASAAWVGQAGDWAAFAYVHAHGFQPTSAVLLDRGDVIVLERRYTPGAGTAVRLAQIAREDIQPGRRVEGRELARFATPYTVDNFEAIALAPGPDGAIRLFLMSDDNFNPLQRTLFMLFELSEEPRPERAVDK